MQIGIDIGATKIEYVILLGDRYEMLGAAISARNLGLKIFHIGGQ